MRLPSCQEPQGAQGFANAELRLATRFEHGCFAEVQTRPFRKTFSHGLHVSSTVSDCTPAQQSPATGRMRARATTLPHTKPSVRVATRCTSLCARARARRVHVLCAGPAPRFHNSQLERSRIFCPRQHGRTSECPVQVKRCAPPLDRITSPPPGELAATRDAPIQCGHARKHARWVRRSPSEGDFSEPVSHALKLLPTLFPLVCVDWLCTATARRS